MAGTNVSFGDNDLNNDHVFYGNGCPNGWDDSKPNAGGSTVACDSSTATTMDGETLSTKTVYSFQAATSGAGSTVITANANSPDTFCPLGWQLPYGGTGGDYYDKSGSWDYLFNAYSIPLSGNSGTGARKLRSYPISVVLGGRYYWPTASLFVHRTAGHFWSKTASTTGNVEAYKMNVWTSGDAINSNVPYSKGNGLSVRCVFHRRHGGRG